MPTVASTAVIALLLFVLLLLMLWCLMLWWLLCSSVKWFTIQIYNQFVECPLGTLQCLLRLHKFSSLNWKLFHLRLAFQLIHIQCDGVLFWFTYWLSHNRKEFHLFLEHLYQSVTEDKNHSTELTKMPHVNCQAVFEKFPACCCSDCSVKVAVWHDRPNYLSASWEVMPC